MVARFPDENHDPDLYQLVEKYQYHNCTNYCMSRNGKCRFGFPKEPETQSCFRSEGDRTRAFYKRDVRDNRINTYNPYLLKLTKAAMDIQVNFGDGVLFYLSKYLTKVDADINLYHNMQSQKDHIKARSVGAVEAAYFLCGWNKHRNSRGIVFINTAAPHCEQRRNLRKHLHRLSPNSVDIFTKNHFEKYLDRYWQLYELTLPEYFILYRITYVQDFDDEFDNEVDTEEQFGERTGDFHQAETLEYDNRVGLNLPVACTDKSGYRYIKRSLNRKLPFWRTHFYSHQEREAFFYQNLILYKPFHSQTELDNFKLNNNNSWRDAFYRASLSQNFKMPEDKFQSIQRIDRNFMAERFNNQTDLQIINEQLNLLLQSASREQLDIFHSIVSNPGVHTVYGAAGTGKSFLLRMLSKHFLVQGFNPVVLAPTGIAAVTAEGQTIDRFFGLNLHQQNIYNPVRLDDFIKIHPKLVLLIDECSMISSQKLLSLSNELQGVTENMIPFGGFKTIFFGDLAQLPPINVGNSFFFKSPLLKYAKFYRLKTPQRQAQQDTDFIKFLTLLRVGDFHSNNKFLLNFILNRVTPESRVPSNALHLFSTREEVNRYNLYRINNLPGDFIDLKSQDLGPDIVLNETGLLKSFQVKKNVPVILIQNIDVNSGWVNGTHCTITDYNSDTEQIILTRTSDGSVKVINKTTREVYRTSYSRTQFPIVIAFASTTHKVQSLTVDTSIAVSLIHSLKSPGQLYVACSRVRSGNQLFFTANSLNRISIGTNKELEDFVKLIERIL